MTWRVLVVEDDPVAAAAHAAYVDRVAGFATAAVAATAREAVLALRSTTVDLILLDLHLPDGAGLALLQRVRSDGFVGDVIAVTSARELTTVRRAVASGVVSYVLKPFTFATLRDRLDQYAHYRARLADGGDALAQHEVDQAFALLRPAPTTLPKGLSEATLDEIAAVLRDRGTPLSASEVAEAAGVSRITARRYLEHLLDTGVVTRRSRHGGQGRPEVEYALDPTTS